MKLPTQYMAGVVVTQGFPDRGPVRVYDYPYREQIFNSNLTIGLF